MSNNNQGDGSIYGCSNGIRYVAMDESMFPAILKHIRESFCHDEILGKSLGYTEAFADDICVFTKNNMTAGKDYSIVALDEQTGEVVGVRVSKVGSKSDKHDDPVFGEALTKVMTFLGYLESFGNVFEKYKVDTLFEFVIVSVSSKYRGRGIATELVSRSLNLGKEKGFKIVKGTFTGLFSQKIANKMGFQVESEVMYKDYIVDGEVVFCNTGEHPSAKWMVKVL